MVTPETGTINFLGRSGQMYTYSIYSSDVVNAPLTFSSIGLAGSGSQNFLIANEDMVMTDISITTGNTVATTFNFYSNDANLGMLCAEANILNTLTTRSFPRVGYKKSSKITILQA
jgi:hypothetical protein